MRRGRKANRLNGFNYQSERLYFITSCVRKMICCFGEISDGKMIPNEFGQIANHQWLWLTQQFKYIRLHAFVVMPNHIHGIIEIDGGGIVGTGREFGTGHELAMGRDVGTGRDLSLLTPTEKIKSLSEIMGAYKTTVSKQIHLAGYPEFQWQRSFYDRIIRDENAYLNISRYIINNPGKWENDKFNRNPT